jgi:hypothetical protein
LVAGGQAPDEGLLALLFPRGPWSPALALRLMVVLGERSRTGPVVRRLADTVLIVPPPAELAQYAELCIRLADPPIHAALPPEARLRVDMLADIGDWPDRIEGAGAARSALRTELAEWFARLSPDERRLAEALLLAPAHPTRVRAELVVTLPSVRRVYCTQLAASLGRRGGDHSVAKSALRTLRYIAALQTSPMSRGAQQELDVVLRRTVGRWSHREQTLLMQFIEHDSKRETTDFVRHWFQQAPPGILDRVRRRLGGRRSDPAAGDTEPQRRSF